MPDADDAVADKMHGVVFSSISVVLLERIHGSIWCGLSPAVGIKEAMMNYLDDKQKLTSWKTGPILHPLWTSTEMQILHDLWQDMSSKFVGFVDWLDIFYDQNPTGSNSWEPKKRLMAMCCAR